MAFHLYKRGSTSGVFLQNAEFFTPPGLPADIRSSLFNAIWSISIIPTTTSNFEYTVDGGLTFFPLSSKPLPAGVEAICNVTTEGIDTLNIRCPDAAGCTVYRVIVSIAPQDIQRRAIEITGGVAALPVDICPVLCDVPIINGSVSPLLVSVGAPPVGTPNGVIILSLTNAAVLANTDISVADLSPAGTSAGDAVIFRIEWAADGVGVLSMTLDSTNFVEYNNGANLRSDSLHLFDSVVEDGDLFNLRFNKAVTIRFLRVIQVL